ncbi:ensconsin isoform X2 [Drosophila serrata]|uniref:ensconsin isoform X2 n=1 Tax=Drosophila serrata TaxID=7274 RepID=UPI000A1D0499|nr:ensconsin isoform X2 [Drosophila serrata]
MRLFAAATVALVLLLGQAAGEELTEERESSEATETTTEQQAAVTEPPIKLVHVLNPGEREYLSPNLIGVQNIAMTFLPLSMNFVNIIDAFREITSGVRYEILLNAENTKVKPPAEVDTICRLVILEKPWLRTQWGDKHRELVTSNCTDSAENSVSGDPEEKARLLNEKYVSNSIFNGGQRNELTDAEMANLESQILTNLGPTKRKVSLTKSAPAVPSAAPAPASPPADSEAPISTSITVTKWTPPAPESTNEATTALSIDEAEKKVEMAEAEKKPEVVEEEGVTTTTIATELNDNEKRWLDDFLSVSAYNFEMNHQGRKEILQDEEEQEQKEEEQRQQQEETTPEEKDPEVEATTTSTTIPTASS